jgi:hypothetical protein
VSDTHEAGRDPSTMICLSMFTRLISSQNACLSAIFCMSTLPVGPRNHAFDTPYSNIVACSCYCSVERRSVFVSLLRTGVCPVPTMARRRGIRLPYPLPVRRFTTTIGKNWGATHTRCSVVLCVEPAEPLASLRRELRTE